MKFHTLLFIILFSITGHITFGQRIVSERNQWNVRLYSGWSGDVRSASYRFEGDTLINNLLYKKVLQSNDSLNITWHFIDQYIRDDSMGRVYYKAHEREEVLIYDFTLQVGDTFDLIDPIYIDFPDPCLYIVDKIDSVTLNNGERRKRLTFAPWWQPDQAWLNWIEGIGESNGGIASGFWNNCAFDSGDYLLCFYEDGMVQYPEDPESCFITPVKEIQDLNSIEVYPNPVQDELTVNFNQENHGYQKISFHSLSGVLILEQNITLSQVTLDLQTLSSGIYMLVIHHENQSSVVQRIVKLN